MLSKKTVVQVILFTLLLGFNLTFALPSPEPNPEPAPNPNPNPNPPIPYKGTCTFSCPLQDEAQRNLLSSQRAVNYGSEYSIFECIYLVNTTPLTGQTRKCSYFKDSGLQALSSKADDCPSQAPPCLSSSSSNSNSNSKTNDDSDFDSDSEIDNSDIESTPFPIFSHLKYEVPSWVEFNRYTLNLMHNPIPSN